MNAMNDATARQVQAANPHYSTWLAANAGAGKTRLATALDDVPHDDLLALGSRLRDNVDDFQTLADLDAQILGALRERMGDDTLIRRIPYFSQDIHSFQGLNRVRSHLFEL